MSTLVCVKKVVFEVDYGDLEAFILEQFGREYEIAPGEEASNGSNLRMDIKAEPNSDYYQKQLDRFIAGEGEPTYMVRPILTHLCHTGKIEPGCYIIRVSW